MNGVYTFHKRHTGSSLKPRFSYRQHRVFIAWS